MLLCQMNVKLLVDNTLAGVIIDRFGKNVIIYPVNEAQFTVNVYVHVSNQFLSWIMSLGNGIKIIGPEVVCEQMKAEIMRLQK